MTSVESEVASFHLFLERKNKIKLSLEALFILFLVAQSGLNCCMDGVLGGLIYLGSVRGQGEGGGEGKLRHSFMEWGRNGHSVFLELREVLNLLGLFCKGRGDPALICWLPEGTTHV